MENMKEIILLIPEIFEKVPNYTNSLDSIKVLTEYYPDHMLSVEYIWYRKVLRFISRKFNNPMTNCVFIIDANLGYKDREMFSTPEYEYINFNTINSLIHHTPDNVNKIYSTTYFEMTDEERFITLLSNPFLNNQFEFNDMLSELPEKCKSSFSKIMYNYNEFYQNSHDMLKLVRLLNDKL